MSRKLHGPEGSERKAGLWNEARRARDAAVSLLLEVADGRRFREAAGETRLWETEELDGVGRPRDEGSDI